MELVRRERRLRNDSRRLFLPVRRWEIRLLMRLLRILRRCTFPLPSSLIPPSFSFSFLDSTQNSRVEIFVLREADEIENSALVWPRDVKGAFSLTRGDLARLNEHQYLNDTLIELGLKLVSFPHSPSVFVFLNGEDEKADVGW